MSIDLTIDAGTGLGGNPKKLELVSLLVNNRDKTIDIMYSEYTLIDGEKVKEQIYSYSLVDGVEQANKAGVKIQAKDAQGNPVFEEDGVTPKYLTQQFTRWVTAFKPYLWDATGVIKDGIKEYHGLV